MMPEIGVPTSSTYEAVVLHLRPRRAMLILDNCEHLLTAVAALVESPMAACPYLHLLATSREPIGIAGEALWPVPPLSVPTPNIEDPHELLGSEAVRLFEDRAAKVQPSFAITAGSAAVVTALCRGLDGLPLAIELAAARVRAFPVSHIAAALDDRFRLLAARSRTVPARQQTLRATIDWSYDLLDNREQLAFQQLSVFSGGCSLEAAEHVLGRAGLAHDDLVDVIGGLVEKSMVIADTDGLSPRYSMLESLRLYGRTRLTEEKRWDQAQEAHRQYFLRFAEAAEPGLEHAEYRQWHRRVAEDYDNLRSAFDGALAVGDVTTALRLASHLWFFWGTADRHGEGSTWLEAALTDATEDISPGVRAAGCTVLSYLAGQQYDLERALDPGLLRWRESASLRHCNGVEIASKPRSCYATFARGRSDQMPGKRGPSSSSHWVVAPTPAVCLDSAHSPPIGAITPRLSSS